MTPQDRQRIKILVVLLFVLAVTLTLGYRMNREPIVVNVQAGDAKTSANPAQNDARIRIDLVEKPEASENVGRTNLFQYRQPKAAAPPPGAQQPGAVPAPPGTGPSMSGGPMLQRPAGPPPPPPPPPIPLKYIGFAVVNSQNGSLVAVLGDDLNRHYNVTVGEVLFGRYRIVRVTDTSVEVEDLEYNRRQTLPLLKQ